MVIHTRLVLAICLIVCSLQLTAAVTVKEEAYSPLEAGNSKLRQQHQHSSSKQNEKFVKKEYLNKEVLVNDEDDDDEDNNSAASSSSASHNNKNPIIPNAPVLNNKNELETSEFGLFGKHKYHPKQRNQRVDQAHHAGGGDDEADVFEKLKAFHRQGALQAHLQKTRADRLDFDYDQMVSQMLKANDEQSLEKLLAKMADQDEEGDENDEDAGSEDDGYELNDNDLAQLFAAKNTINAQRNNKPVSSNVVGVKESLMEENDYNRQFIKKQQNLDALDSGNMIAAEIVNSQAINSGSKPALALKQSNVHTDNDHSISSKLDSLTERTNYLFIFIVGGCALAGVVALVAAGVCWHTMHKSTKPIVLSDYGSSSSKSGKFNSSGSKLSLSSGDRRLAQSAQMYHYQHQKQQMIAMEKANNDTKPDNQSDSEGETEEGDYTVYECPGLAPTGEMEVKNPLFKEEFSSNNISALNVTSTTPQPPAYASVIKLADESKLASTKSTTAPPPPPAVVITLNESIEEKRTSSVDEAETKD